MLRLGWANFPLTTPDSAASEAKRVELVLARARTFLGACCLIAVYVDPSYPLQYSALATGFVAGYLVCSVGSLFLLHFGRTHVSARLQVIIHGIDLVWAIAITLVSAGPSSLFFLFFIFVLLAAAYRWGLQNVLITTAITIAALGAEALIVNTPEVAGEFETNRLIVRFGYLGLVGVLAGYLSEHEKIHRAQILAVTTLLQKAQNERTLRATMKAVLGEVLRLFSAKQALLAIEEKANGTAYLWRLSLEGDIDCYELDRVERANYFWEGVQGPIFASRTDLAVGRPAPRTGALTPGFFQQHDFKSLATVPISFNTDEWTGRLFVMDPAFDMNREMLDFLVTTFAQVAPAVYNVYLFRRLRSRIGGIERARLAHELHDGVIQSLVAAEMRLEVMRRQSRGDLAQNGDLTRIQEIVRGEVGKLRSLMDQLRPTELNPRELPGFLTELVEKFRAETGIATHLLCDDQDLAIPPTVAREIAQIMQEALVNVRKHAEAKKVLVRFGLENDVWKLVIQDDGQGFGFSGRLSEEEVNRGWQAPLIIRERVARTGGRLEVESTPGVGARLEITIPKASRA